MIFEVQIAVQSVEPAISGLNWLGWSCHYALPDTSPMWIPPPPDWLIYYNHHATLHALLMHVRYRNCQNVPDRLPGSNDTHEIIAMATKYSQALYFGHVIITIIYTFSSLLRGVTFSFCQGAAINVTPLSGKRSMIKTAGGSHATQRLAITILGQNDSLFAT